MTESAYQTRTIVTSTKTCSLEPFPSVQRKTPGTPGKGERISPSSALAQRNLSAVALSVKGQYRPHCRYDFLDLGEVENNTRKALACAVGTRPFITEPALAELVTNLLSADIEDGKAVIFECNPGEFLYHSLLSFRALGRG